MKNKILQFAPIIGVLVIVLVWQILCSIINAEIIMPNIGATLKNLISIFAKKSFYKSIISCLLRVFISFSLALIIAVLCAILSNLSRVFERALYPLIIVVRAVPTMSIIFLCLIWFNSKISPIVVAFTVAFPILYANIISRIKACDKQIIEMSTVYCVPKKVQIFQFFLPTVVKNCYDETVATLSFTVKLVISAEALARTRESLGFSMTVAKEGLETAELFAYTLVCVLLSFLLELVFKLIKKAVEKKYGRN
ncbi:MAG: ABC transporter permease subunit [Clostridia bacterium]|nr:ABC transporter permease subunit [Clostridia bacterium]